MMYIKNTVSRTNGSEIFANERPRAGGLSDLGALEGEGKLNWGREEEINSEG